MKQEKYLNKIIICILCFVFAGCAVNKNVEENTESEITNTVESENINKAKRDSSYKIEIVNTADIYELKVQDLPWFETFNFNVIETHTKADSAILEAVTGWLNVVYTDEIDFSDSTYLDIMCHSDKYLSFCNTFENSSPPCRYNLYQRDYITIDMTTGERVFLDDLVELNEDFIKCLKYNKNKLAKPGGMGRGISRTLDNNTPEEILEKLQECTVTNEDYLNSGYICPILYNGKEPSDYTTKYTALLMKASFYLEEGRLIIVIPENILPTTLGIINISVDDIEPFLKVEKW